MQSYHTGCAEKRTPPDAHHLAFRRDSFIVREAFVQESILLYANTPLFDLSPPTPPPSSPTRLRYLVFPPTILCCITCHTILVMAISCKGQPAELPQRMCREAHSPRRPPICSADGSTLTESNKLYRKVKHRARPNLSSRQRPKRPPIRRRSRRRQRRGEPHTEHGLGVPTSSWSALHGRV